jgi:regulation of enolase protein 1 (concanavalin A-like superfamily)
MDLNSSRWQLTFNGIALDGATNSIANGTQISRDNKRSIFGFWDSALSGAAFWKHDPNTSWDNTWSPFTKSIFTVATGAISGTGATPSQLSLRYVIASDPNLPAPLPLGPTGLAATANSSAVNLTWDPLSGATAYVVKRSVFATGPFNVLQSNVTGTSYSDTTVSNSLYYYTVSAITASGSTANATPVLSGIAPLLPYCLNGDIGDTGATGSAFLQNGGRYTILASGSDIWGTADGFQFMYQQVTGDCDIRARVTGVQNTNVWAKAGVMIRNTLDAGSAFSDVTVTPSQGIAAQWRSVANGGCSNAGASGAAPYWVRLVRSGNAITSYRSTDGITWTAMASNTIIMNSTVYVGLAVSSHAYGTLCTATFDNYSVVALPSPWSSSDVGTVGSAGSASLTGSTYTVAGSGADIWGTADAFRYVYQAATGDCDITARVSDLTFTNVWGKAGVMIRETLSANSTHAMVVISSSNGIAFQNRASTGGSSSTKAGPMVSVPYWVRLVRAGDVFTGYASPDGVNWTQVGSVTIPMASSVYIGLPVTSHADGALSVGFFDNVVVNP